MEALGINTGNLFINIVCFLIALWVIVHFVVGPVQKMMDKRSEIINEGLENAKEADEKLKNANEQASSIVSDAMKEKETIIKSAKSDAETLKEKSIEEAKEKIDIDKNNELKAIEEERNRILSNMREQIVDISIGGTKRIIDESILPNREAQRKIILDMLTSLNSSSIDINSLHKRSNKLIVTTAIPLLADEKATIAAELKWSLNPNNEIEYTVEPNILGGMVIRTDDQLIDLSILGETEALKKALYN